MTGWTSRKVVTPSPPVPEAPVQEKPVAPNVPPPPAGGQSRFDVAVRYVLLNEDGFNWDHDNGEYTNDPRDPGGRTIWGIIQTEYEGYLGRKLSEAEMKAMSRNTALEIYKKNFWLPIQGDLYFRDGDAIAIFDTAVNKGLGGCMTCIRDALKRGFGGVFSLDVIDAVNSMSRGVFIPVFEAAVDRYDEGIIARYPKMAWARNGWHARTKRLLTLG